MIWFPERPHVLPSRSPGTVACVGEQAVELYQDSPLGRLMCNDKGGGIMEASAIPNGDECGATAGIGT
jgi:hypothetical protein